MESGLISEMSRMQLTSGLYRDEDVLLSWCPWVQGDAEEHNQLLDNWTTWFVKVESFLCLGTLEISDVPHCVSEILMFTQYCTEITAYTSAADLMNTLWVPAGGSWPRRDRHIIHSSDFN